MADETVVVIGGFTAGVTSTATIRTSTLRMKVAVPSQRKSFTLHNPFLEGHNLQS
jgi:hypothetical protein